MDYTFEGYCAPDTDGETLQMIAITKPDGRGFVAVRDIDAVYGDQPELCEALKAFAAGLPPCE